MALQYCQAVAGGDVPEPHLVVEKGEREGGWWGLEEEGEEEKGEEEGRGTDCGIRGA